MIAMESSSTILSKKEASVTSISTGRGLEEAKGGGSILKNRPLQSKGSDDYIFATQETVSNNPNNPHKIDTLANSHLKKSLHLIKNHPYIEGESSKVEDFLESIYQSSNGKPDSHLVFEKLITKTVLRLIKEEMVFLANFISTLSHIDFEKIGESLASQVILMSSAVNSDIVNEAALRAAESWNSKSTLACLEKIRPFEVKWLETYRYDVINQIKES